MGLRAEALEHVRLAAPVCVGMLANRFIAAVSVVFVGRMGPAYLAPAALATTISNVLGNSIMVGLTSASSTLAGQAYGAGNYHEVGLVLQRSIGIIALVLTPITLSWLCMERLLLATGQDAQLASKAGQFILYLIPGLWGYAGKMAFQNYLHAQRHTTPTAVAGLAAALAIVPMNMLCMDMLGFVGAAVANSFTQVITLVFLVAYALVKGLHTQTWPGWSREAFGEWGHYLRLALPGVLMLSEWWASEINIFTAGYLPDADRQLATMAIYQTTIGLAFMIPVGIGVATNVRVSNSVGAQQLPVARRAAALGFVLALLSTVATALLLLAARRPWASLFTADAALMDGVMRVVLVASVYIIADGTTCALGGCLQGCGRQGMAGWVVVFSYYVVGLPLAWLLGFQQKWGVVGLTSGLCVGSYVHCLIYAGMVLTTNWELQALRAKERMAHSASRDGIGKAPSAVVELSDVAEGGGAEQVDLERVGLLLDEQQFTIGEL